MPGPTIGVTPAASGLPRSKAGAQTAAAAAPSNLGQSVERKETAATTPQVNHLSCNVSDNTSMISTVPANASQCLLLAALLNALTESDGARAFLVVTCHAYWAVEIWPAQLTLKYKGSSQSSLQTGSLKAEQSKKSVVVPSYDPSWDPLTLEYQVKWPLHLVLTPQVQLFQQCKCACETGQTDLHRAPR